MNEAPKLMLPLLGAAAGVAVIAGALFYGLMQSGGKSADVAPPANLAEAPAVVVVENPADAGLAALAVGELARLQLSEVGVEQPTTVFRDADGVEMTLADVRGKPILMNLWATWCAPCVRELPELDRLHAEFGGDDFAVLAISLDRDIAGAKQFYEDASITALDFHSDATMRFGADVDAVGLPMTILYDAEGQELARMARDAHWDGPEAKALVRYVLGAE